MEPVFELAGWYAAEAIRLLSQNLASASPSSGESPGALLQPFLVIQKAQKRQIVILAEASPKAFADIEVVLDRLSPSDISAVLVKDAFITIDGRKSDALIIDRHRLLHPRQSFCMAITYERPGADRPFAVHKPKLISHGGFELSPLDADGAFGRGRDSHPEGAAAWRAHETQRGGEP